MSEADAWYEGYGAGATAARAEALEEAAKIVEDLRGDFGPPTEHTSSSAKEMWADLTDTIERIRALKERKP